MRVESIAPYVHHKVYYHITDMLSKTVVSPTVLYSDDPSPISIQNCLQI